MIIELNEKTIETIVKAISVAAVSLLVAGVTYTVTTLHDVEKKQDLIDYKLDQVSFVLQDIYENKKNIAMYPPWLIKGMKIKSIKEVDSSVSPSP